MEVPYDTGRAVMSLLMSGTLARLPEIYMHCSYAITPRKHEIKTALMSQMRRVCLEAGCPETSVTLPVGRDERPTVVVIAVHELSGGDDLTHRDLRRGPGEGVAAARTLGRDQQAGSDQPLEHLGHQLDRDVVLLGDLTRARRRRPALFGQVLHRHEGVIRFLREPQHWMFYIRP